MSKFKKCSLFIIVIVSFGGIVGGVSGEEAMTVLHTVAAKETSPPPLMLAKTTHLNPIAVLERAEIAVPGEVNAIATWNAAGQKPTKTGFFRRLSIPENVLLDEKQVEEISGGLSHSGSLVRLDSDLKGEKRTLFKKTDSGFVWAARLKVEGAWGLRAKLSNARLPSGTELWVYGDNGEYSTFGTELIRPDGHLWTPTVFGEVLNLEILVPEESVDAGEIMSFDFDQVAQIFRIDSAGVPLTDLGDKEVADKFCTEGAACFTSTDSAFDTLKRATAYLEIVFSDGIATCSGTLLNSSDGQFDPYLLTANHCLDNQNDATSTTFYFDYIPNTCGGADPPASLLPRVHGAVLLANRPASDSSFLELLSRPSGSRGYAGWTTVAPAAGERLHSLSHPNGRSMRYSRTFVVSQGGCGLSLNEYLFSDQDIGGVQGGSSGSHIFNDSFRVVGQLRGACGVDPSDGCFYSLNNRFDGRFARFFPTIQPWLQPSSASCVESPTTMCLNDDRFEVKATYLTSTGDIGNGQGVEMTEDTGYFWFFNSSNVESVIKVLSACNFNNHYWVFVGGLTDLGIDFTVRDTVTGNVWNGTNTLGQAFRTITDTSALACN